MYDVSLSFPQLDGLNLPSLLLCDLQYNNIADVGVLVRLTSACKRIRDFDVRDNPVVSTWGWKVRWLRSPVCCRETLGSLRRVSCSTNRIGFCAIFPGWRA